MDSWGKVTLFVLPFALDTHFFYNAVEITT